MMRLGVVVVALTTLSTWGVQAADGQRPRFFAYRSFWPEFAAMRQFKEAGVHTVCIFAANTDNSLGQPYVLSAQ